MARLRFARFLAAVLVATVVLWLAPSAHAVFTITLTPNSGLAGTLITIAGSQPNIGAPSLDHSCIVSSVPGGLISTPTCTVTQTGSGSYTVSGSFTVDSGASSGPYTVTVTVTESVHHTPFASASTSFTVNSSPSPNGGATAWSEVHDWHAEYEYCKANGMKYETGGC